MSQTTHKIRLNLGKGNFAMKYLALFLLTSFFTHSSWAESIGTFINRVKEKNLEISAQTSIVSASKERSKGYSLMAPMVGVSQMKSGHGTSYNFEVQQEIPLSNRLTSDKKMRESSFELQKKESDFFVREKLLEARLAFVAYWRNYEKQKYIKEVRDWLKQHLKYAQSLVRSDANSQIYALEIESYLGILENELSSVTSLLESDKAKLKELSFDENYGPDVPVLDEPPVLADAIGTSRISSINLSKLRVASAKLDVAKASYLPNLSVTVRKMDRPMLGMADQEIMLGIDLPFAFFWRPRAEKAEAIAQKAVADATYRKSEVEGEALKKSLKVRADILKKQIKTLEEVSIPAVQKSLKYVRNIAPRDMAGLETHRRLFQDYISLRSQMVDLRMSYEEIYSHWTSVFAEGHL